MSDGRCLFLIRWHLTGKRIAAHSSPLLTVLSITMVRLIFHGSYVTRHEYYRPQTKLRKGNVFTPAIPFTGGVGFPACITGHLTSIHGGLHPADLHPGGLHLGVCIQGDPHRGDLHMRAGQTPPPTRTRNAVVCILLECFPVRFGKLNSYFTECWVNTS